MRFITRAGYDDRAEPSGEEAAPRRQETEPQQTSPDTTWQESSSRPTATRTPATSTEAEIHQQQRNLDPDCDRSGDRTRTADDICIGDYGNGREGDGHRPTPGESGNRAAGISSIRAQFRAAGKEVLDDEDEPAPTGKKKGGEDSGRAFVIASRKLVPRNHDLHGKARYLQTEFAAVRSVCSGGRQLWQLIQSTRLLAAGL